MASRRIGIWLIGARGGVAATATLGLIALRNRLVDSSGLVSELPPFRELDLANWGDFVVGGHEIRDETLLDSLQRLRDESRLLDDSLLSGCRAELETIDTRIRPGSLTRCGSSIEGLAGKSMQEFADETPWVSIKRLQADLQAFQRQLKVDQVIVVNVASTEPIIDSSELPSHWDKLVRLIEEPARCPLPASSLYAIAALDLGMPYINFTPSLGSTPAAIRELAEQRKTCYAGQDGKTGETLLKSVLAPMFAARNMEIMSWVGHNIFGNLDGKILDDPANKSAKIEGKDRLLGKILGYDPQTLVSIEYIRSLGDWKTAWDHIHFRGFLNTPMTMQFTWQGSDSLLASPLVLDLVRFVELADRRGETGVLAFLGSFFKSPLGMEEHAFSRQFMLLEEWAQRSAT